MDGEPRGDAGQSPSLAHRIGRGLLTALVMLALGLALFLLQWRVYCLGMGACEDFKGLAKGVIAFVLSFFLVSLYAWLYELRHRWPRARDVCDVVAGLLAAGIFLGLWLTH